MSKRSSTYIYQFATRGNFEEGALAALIIVAVGILPVIRITRYADEAPLANRARRSQPGTAAVSELPRHWAIAAFTAAR